MQQIYIGRDESGNLTRYVLTRQKLEDSSASSASLSLPPKKLFLRRKQFFDQIALASVPVLSLINASSVALESKEQQQPTQKRPKQHELKKEMIRQPSMCFPPKTQKPTTQMMVNPIRRTKQLQKQAMHQRIDHLLVEFNITLNKEKDVKWLRHLKAASDYLVDYGYQYIRRSGLDPSIEDWAGSQRKAFTRGEIAVGSWRHVLLQFIGFVFDN